MKHLRRCLYVLTLLLTLSMTSFAPTSKDIPLKGRTDDLDNRSIFPQCIYASIDGTSLHSEFIYPIGEVRIVITDLTGSTIVRQETVRINSEQSYGMQLSALPKGNYTIWYYYGEEHLFGEFKIE